ncbi:hypothetical protein C8F01DRAFT_1263279 [Mycena amicta]|nr:hypothetical protein C8F01DRAFT_1263279 [Mycena amicta]
MSSTPSIAPSPSSHSRRASVEDVPDVDDPQVPLARAESDKTAPGVEATGVKVSKSKANKKAVPLDIPDGIEVEMGQRNWAKGLVEDQILAPGEAAYAEAVCSGNHAAVGWRTAMKARPIGPLPHWDETVVLPEEPGLSEAEEKVKAWIIEQMRERIERYYSYRYETTRGKSVKASNADDPYSVLFTELAGIVPVKKCLQGYQQYMKESYAAEIAPVVNSRWLDERDKAPDAKAPPAHYRAKIARELFNDLDKTTQAAIKGRAKLTAQREREEYAERLRSWPDRTPECVQRAIDNLPGVMHRIMQGIADATGMQFFLVGGGPTPRYGGEIRTIHMSIGQNRAPVPTSFPLWKRAHFNQEILGSFKEYLATAYTPAQRMAMALPDDDDADFVLDNPDLLSMTDMADASAPAPSSTNATSSSAAASSSKTPAASSSKKVAVSDDDMDDSDVDKDDEEADRNRRLDYAKMRNENIARNKALLAALDLSHAKEQLGEKPAPKPRKRRQQNPTTTQPVRCSQRHSGPTDAMDVITPAVETDVEMEVVAPAVTVVAPVVTTGSDTEMDVIPSTVASTDSDPSSASPNANEDASEHMEVDVGPVPLSAIPECPADAAEWLRGVYPSEEPVHGSASAEEEKSGCRASGCRAGKK